eukprot:1297775-Rhodomonas_salina.1
MRACIGVETACSPRIKHPHSKPQREINASASVALLVWIGLSLGAPARGSALVAERALAGT